MGGDYSRNRFNPKSDFGGVFMQQGRVQLDSDWNELVDALDRRWRAGTTDIVGEGIVPRETPDGFNIEIGSPAKLTIGRGRIYVHGLLAENHGAGAKEFDPVLAEERGTEPIAYEDQPYFPNAKLAAPLPQSGGPYLAYVDVWQREVTYLEDPALIESAIGVDTTTRFQTAWQVKLLSVNADGDAAAAAVTCATPIPAWDNLIRTSGGRLTTAAVGVASNNDLCQVPPEGGYRSLDNRFYRIEIHNGGAADGKGATFKWSRDNASLATNVVAISADLFQLTVASIGRDSVMRFKAGDWIEVTDDWFEFASQPGIDPKNQPGVLVRIKGVVNETQTIILENALPNPLFVKGATDPKRHTRIRRWDQQGKIFDTKGTLLVDLDLDKNGVIPVPVPGASMVLEDGVQITFDLDKTGNGYHVADYWNFAARTADASIEILTDAPPRGIHHHYARLAILNASTRTLQDCRTLWPQPVSDCCVELVARPGVGWEKIFDKVSNGSNSVICFPPGDYPITTTITVADKGHLLLYGSGRATRLMGNGLMESVVTFTNCKGIDIRDLYVYGGGPDPHKKHLLGTLTLRRIQKIALTRIITRCKPGREKGMACVRVENEVDKGGNVKVQECTFYIGHLQIGLLITNAESIRIHSNHFMASGRDVKKGKQLLQNPDVQVLSVAAQAIVIGGTRADHVLIESNEVDRAVQGIHVGLSHSTRTRTVEHSDFLGRVILRQNKVNCLSRPNVSPCHGLFVGNVRSLTIKDNHLTLAPAVLKRSCDGIRVFGFLGEMVLIRGNHISGFIKAIRMVPLSWDDEPPTNLRVRVMEENYAPDEP